MTKQEIAEKATEMILESGEEVKKVQVILLGNGGWITTTSWETEDE